MEDVVKAEAGWTSVTSPLPQRYPAQEISAYPGSAHRNKVVDQGSQKPCEESYEVEAGKSFRESTFSPAPPPPS